MAIYFFKNHDELKLPESEFNDFEPGLKSLTKPVSIECRLRF